MSYTGEKHGRLRGLDTDANHVHLTQVEKTALLAAMADGVVTAEVTPVNAVAGSVVLAAADLDIMAVGDIVLFDGLTLTKAAQLGAAAWSSAAELAGLINAHTDWSASEGAGAVTITSVVKGLLGNGARCDMDTVEATTAGGGEAAYSTAVISAASIARLAVGDQVMFAGGVFTKAAVTAVPQGEFANTAGLAECLNTITGWGAVVDTTHIDVTAAEFGVAHDGEAIGLNLYRTTAGGVNGTVANKGATVFDTTHIWIATADNTIADANWKSATLA